MRDDVLLAALLSVWKTDVCSQLASRLNRQTVAKSAM